VSTERVCGSSRRYVIDGVTAGQELHLLVDGAEPNAAGAFELRVESRPIVCGDGHRDGTEQCDDGNVAPGDGCDANCQVEQSPGSSYIAPSFYGWLDTAEQVVSVTTTDPSSTIVATTKDFGDESCVLEELDSSLDILAADGATVLASDDDSGEGTCSHVVATGLTPGTYWLRVRAAGQAAPFAYVLEAIVDPCGNGVQVEGEGCDDGNTTPWDGCSPVCQPE